MDKERQIVKKKNMSKAKAPNINELYSIVDDGYTSEPELNTRQLVSEMNRKKKKSGGFQSMGLTYNVFGGIMKKGYKVPTPIQRKCIPLILQGKDVVAMARTGSGKTAAFLIPILEKLQSRQSVIGARALVLSPTRELALQTYYFLKELGRLTDLRTACILGGDRMEDQFAALHESPDILIATPGRLTHVLVEMELKLKAVQYVVFDEADRLFELGFQEQLSEILRRLPADRQTMLFSATLPRQVIEFAKAGLNDPTLVRLDVDSKLSEQLKLAFLHVNSQDKLATLLYLLRSVCKEKDQSLIFVATKHHVEYLYEILTYAGFKCSSVYSSLDQVARRLSIERFRKKSTKLLIVTDLAARGLDIPVLDNVINFNFPAKSKLFVHRVGRVARAGRTGSAYSLVSAEELPYVLDLHLFLGRPLEFVQPNRKYNSWDDVYGSVSQIAIDEEHTSLQTFIHKSEFTALQKVSENAYKQYIRSRPVASPESIKRSKELLQTLQLIVHPIFDDRMDNTEKLRLQLLNSVKNYKPNTTIFEIGATAKTTGAGVMRARRKKNAKFVSKFNETLLKKKEVALEKLQASRSKQPFKIDATLDAEIKNAFPTVIRSSKSHPFVAKPSKSKKEKTSFKDEEFYIDYKPKDYYSEAGLSVGAGEKNFSKEAATVSFDLMADEDDKLRRQKAQRKVWDRKRKKFVGAVTVNKELGKKKIRTESGAVISSSYKKNLYDQWKKKSKIDDRDSDPEADGISRTWRIGYRSKFAGKPKVKSRVRSELKHPLDILKERKVKEKNKLKYQEARERNLKKRKKNDNPVELKRTKKKKKGGRK